MIKWLLFFGICVLGYTSSLGQSILPGADETRFFLQKRTLGVGLHLHSQGMGFNTQYFRRLDAAKNTEWALHFDLGNVKDPREVRSTSSFGDRGGRDFIFDKRNYVYTLGIVAGLNKVIYPHTDWSRLSVRLGVGLGPVLAFEKPYMIEYFRPGATISNPTSIEQFDINVHQRRLIVGEADFFKGFDKLKVVPGLRIKTYAILNLAGDALGFRAVELAARVDLFTRRLEIMDSRNNHFAFFALSAAISLGNSW